MNFVLVVGLTALYAWSAFSSRKGAGLCTYITNFQHVKIIPATWLTAVNEPSNFVDDVHHAAVVAWESAVEALLLRTWAPYIRPVKAIVDVAGGTPGVCDRVCPVPRMILSPITHAVDHLPAGVIEGFRHSIVARVRYVGITRLAFIVTVVVPSSNVS